MKDLFELQTLEYDQTVRPGTEERITVLRAKIPLSILGHYDRLGDQGKKGIALLRNQTCSGCHMRVPLADVMTLLHGQDTCQCGNCRRYLYLREDVAKDGVAAVKAVPAKSARKHGALLPA